MARNTFSIGLQHGSDVPLVEPSYAQFTDSTLSAYKNWTFFYRTRVDGSARNSTIYRHAPIYRMSNVTYEDVWAKSSIGFDLPLDQWAYQYAHSKFCLVIRGDTPHSSALLRSLRVGCIPVVASDYFERYSPTLKSSLKSFADFVIFVNEQDFVNDPGRELRKIMQGYNKTTLLDKIAGAKFAQRIAFPDHPQSLFVPAFLKEAWLSLHPLERPTTTLLKPRLPHT